MNTSKKRATKTTQGKIKLAQDEIVAALPVQSGVRAGVVSPVSFKSSPVSFRSFSS